MEKCQVCDCKTFTTFNKNEDSVLVECSECGFIWLNPLPEHEDIKKIYNNAYQNASSSYYTKVEKKMNRSKRRSKFLEKYIKKNSNIKFLDIGSNGGFMVEAARLRGHKATGIEIDPYSIKYAREHYAKNTFFEGDLESYYKNNPQKKFDIIYCSEVIEHLIDINSFILLIKKILDTNGIVFLTTPDIKHWRRPKDLKLWDAYCPPDHCLYFDNNSLSRLLLKFNLKIIKRMIAFKPGIKIIAKHI
ncbi:MAG: Ubiquinone biosynthesis O-methyltransferase [Alphaproteobacteria bacterium MarineAlpha2_Bin1]|nr:MAG: Ubiquinone biosynthesis O-methyltransferase [Alphaproteobacteria bacterium MarineAlpha2_Bin1]|tara:strand:- start:1370 stop:2107 length:738 start_codon:yes stop_codon:yes gene_type:complete